MKLLSLVIGCCVALVASKGAQDTCAEMRVRLLPSLEPSARGDASALRACDADSDGAVDSDELVSCVQRAFGSTARLDRAEIKERMRCFRNIMTATALDGEERHMIANEQEREFGLSFSTVSGGWLRSNGLPNMNCSDQNQLEEILTAIADGEILAAFDELISWYISIISQSSGLLNGLLQNVGLILQSLLSGVSSESLVYLVTEFVRSTSNALSESVEDALISSLLLISIENFIAAKAIIQLRLDAGVLNPITEVELQRIVDAFDAGSTQYAVARIIALLAGCDTSDDDLDRPIFTQLLELYDMALQIGDISRLGQQFEAAKNRFYAIYNQTLEREPPLDNDLMELFERILIKNGIHSVGGIIFFLSWLLVFPCDYVLTFPTFVSLSIIDIRTTGVTSYFDVILSYFSNDTDYSEALYHVELARNASNNSDIDGVFDEYRKIFEACVNLTNV